jgi:hypothetical protein
MTGADLAAAAEAAQRSFAGVGDSALDNAYALPAPPEATPPPEPLARATLSPKKTPKAKVRVRTRVSAWAVTGATLEPLDRNTSLTGRCYLGRARGSLFVWVMVLRC